MPKKEANFWHALYLLDYPQRILLLRRGSPNFIRCICECALNILLGNVPFNPREKKRLRKYASFLRKLADKKEKKKKKNHRANGRWCIFDDSFATNRDNRLVKFTHVLKNVTHEKNATRAV